MSSPQRRSVRIILLVIALLALAAWLIPFFLSAERYRHRLEAGLERVLRRPVTFGAVSFRLLPRLGFSIENAVIHEHPAFGSEPFARVERIECDLRWRSLWRARWELARLRLERPTFNIVRDAQAAWNVETLLLTSGMALPAGASSRDAERARVVLEADDARLNFKIGADKKPFAVTDLRARLSFDPADGALRFRLEGNPVRTDSALPTPGPAELTGEWAPGHDLKGPLNATFRTRGAMLYGWLPLVIGGNPELYGVVDADVGLSGSLRVLKIDGQAQLSQLHRWELLPPSDPMPFTLHFRGEFDRTRGRALVESLDLSFADSRLHLSGSVEQVPTAPELDLVIALERSRLEDLVALGRRFWGGGTSWNLAGRADGLLTIQGRWSERRYGGFISARDLRLTTASGTFPISEAALRIDRNEARLAPVRLTLAPRVELVAEGVLRSSGSNASKARGNHLPGYELSLAANSVPLRDLVRLGRAVGLRSLRDVDAEGVGTAAFRIAGSAWPLSRPAVSGRFDVRAARLFVPGLTEPLNVPRARVLVSGERITVDSVVAVIGTSVFAGKLEHQGEGSRPWSFDVTANTLSLDQGALWFDVLGHRAPLPLLSRIPGLDTSDARRVAASELFSALNARGHFETPALTYRSLSLGDFRCAVEVSGRVVRVDGATFRTGGGRGQGRVAVDLTARPAEVRGEITLAGAQLQTVAPYLPAALRHARGAVSGTGRFETRGLTRPEMSAALTGEAKVQLRKVSFGEFDPLQAILRRSPLGSVEPARGAVGLRSAEVVLEVRDRRVIISDWPLEVEGARLNLTGAFGFDRTVDLEVRADFRGVARRWHSGAAPWRPEERIARLRLFGPLDRLEVGPLGELSQAAR